MGLFAKLRAWLRPQPVKAPTQAPRFDPTEHKQPERRTVRPADPAVAVPATVTPREPAVTGPTAPRVRVSVRFCTRAGQPLQAPLSLAGPIGGPLGVSVPLIEGYVLTEIVGFTATFPDAPRTITYLYEPRVAAPVLVYHRESGGRLLAPPEVLIGKLNADFTARALPELADHADQAEQTGHFAVTSQRLTFTYNLARLTPGTPPAAAFVELLAAKATFAAPDFNQPLATDLPAHTFWRVFALAREHSGQVWLNIGGAQWLTAEDTRPQSADPFRLAASAAPEPDARFAFTTTPDRRAATIVGGANGVTQWAEPYGAVLPLRLAPGTRVMVIASVTAENGSAWLRLQDDSYILARYAE
ncbi:MucBP domain-containing protein [Lacticaseibacillus kribbianus]|uniref:MucBP domain-containing protein n=1 Tax=Lacticaseibacillus kribbianus TaxID=2926292 RepID=UPI001CD720DF|nr:MucBP domain-containing protein [Lacticaseibacillus kribbianus]